MNITNRERTELHKLLDNIIDNDEEVGYLSYFEDIFKPINRYRLIFKYDKQWINNEPLRVPDGS